MNEVCNISKALMAKAMILLLCVATPTELIAQLTDTTNSGRRGSPRIQKISTRDAALGDAGVADHSHLSNININPAGLSFISKMNTAELNISQNWNNSVMLESFMLPALKLNNHAFAAQLSIHHDRGFESLNLLGTNPMPAPEIIMYQLDVVYAIKIQDVLSLGVFNNFSYAENSIAQYSTYFATLGLMYAPSPSISYGITLRGLGRTVIYEVDSPSTTFFGSQNLRETLEIGTTLYLGAETKKPYMAISLANEKRFGEDGLWYKAGLEYSRLSFLALRTGLIFQPETDIYAPRFGVGIIIEILRLDYSVSYSKELYERFHQLGLTLHLDKF